MVLATITDTKSPKVLAMFLKPHLKLVSVGMRNSQFSNRQLLDKATAITGKKYKRGQYDAAIADLDEVMKAEDVATEVDHQVNHHYHRIGHD